RRGVRRGTEQRWAKTTRRVARRALSPVRLRELTFVLVLVTVRAAPERELPVSRSTRQLGPMTTCTTRGLMLTGQRVCRPRMCCQSDRGRESGPLNGRVAGRTRPNERRLVDGRMTRRALPSLGRSDNVALVMAGSASDCGMPIPEAHAR